MLLAIALAIVEADLVVPFFWERRLAVRAALLLAAAIIQLVPGIPAVDGFIRQWSAARSPVARFSHVVVAGVTLITAVWIAVQAAGLFASAQPGTSVPTADSAAGLSSNRSTELLFMAALAALLGFAHLDRISSRFSVEQRTYLPLVFLALCFACIYLFNNLLPLIDTSLWQFRVPSIVPVFNPVGMDFRRGVYLPAHRLLSGTNIYGNDPAKSLNFYPPLVAVLGLPYLLLDENAAYMLHVLILFIANVLCLVIAARLAMEHFLDRSEPVEPRTTLVQVTLVILVASSLFTGYPFLFSIERGNIDILAMLLVLASITVLLKHPNRIWWQIILLSLAVHIKAYPLLLFAVLFFIKGRRIILPSVLVNAALLLLLGPTNAAGFITSLLRYYNPVVWVGNHSGYAFAGLLAGEVPSLAAGLTWLQVLFTCLPLAVWILAWAALTRVPNRNQAILSGFIITIPLMAVFPSVSNDYQLVILSSAVLMLFAAIVTRMADHQDASDYLQLLLVSMATFFIGRSYVLMGASPAILQDKYLWVLLLQFVVLVHILQQFHDGRAGSPQGADPRRGSSRADHERGENLTTQVTLTASQTAHGLR